MPRIFEMFVQLRPALEVGQSGLGVGLALAKKLVELHRGRIDALSEGAGKGSEFIVRVPVSLDEPVAGVKSEEVPLTAFTARRVLIADDYVDSAEVLAAALRDFGHDVVTAHDGLATLAAAEDYKPDVAILDIGMPKMNGLEVARILRERFAHITLIAVTGWGQEADRQRAMQAGFNHHLTKPVDVLAINRFLHETNASIDGRQQSKR
jgi:CheY-like chemotaxis protein